MHISPAVWTQGTGADCQAGKAVKNTPGRIGKAGMGNMILNIWPGFIRVTGNKPRQQAGGKRQAAFSK